MCLCGYAAARIDHSSKQEPRGRTGGTPWQRQASPQQGMELSTLLLHSCVLPLCMQLGVTTQPSTQAGKNEQVSYGMKGSGEKRGVCNTRRPRGS